MTRFILRARPIEPSGSVDDLFAVVEIDSQRARTILQRAKALRALVAEDASACAIHYSDRSVPFYESAHVDEDNDELDDNGWCLATDKTVLGDEARTECDEMVIRQDGISWTFVLKHVDIYMITKELPLAEVEKCIGAEG